MAAASGGRAAARRRALELLFEAEQRGTPALELGQSRETELDPYTLEILSGVQTRQAELDEYLSSYSRGWPLDRMPNVDRNVLRLGAWELLFNPDIPDAVAVHEAVGLAKLFSTDSSPAFVNGVLGKLQDMKPTLLA